MTALDEDSALQLEAVGTALGHQVLMAVDFMKAP